jgi:hypothetical protein
MRNKYGQPTFLTFREENKLNAAKIAAANLINDALCSLTGLLRLLYIAITKGWPAALYYDQQGTDEFLDLLPAAAALRGTARGLGRSSTRRSATKSKAQAEGGQQGRTWMKKGSRQRAQMKKIYLGLVEDYRSFPCLWMATSAVYKDRVKRSESTVPQEHI